MNTLLGGVQRLHETLENSHKLILEASEKAVEPFQKIVLDQAQQAEKFAQNYNAIATNVQSLEKASASALHNAEKMANALDHQVTSAVIESTHRLYRKTEEYISNRNTFLNFIAIGTVVALFAALWSIWSAKRANEGYVDYFYGFRSSVCEYRRGQKEMLEAYLKSVECR
jgi:hypothetical protein